MILGVTASGKGRLAFDLARAINAEIISIDSMKIYRRMDIGTAKPSKQARRQVKYHLIDIVEPSEQFSVGMFLPLAYTAMEQISRKGKPVIAVGGTALYIKALLHGLFDGPGTDRKIRQNLLWQTKTKGLEQLYRQLEKLDPTAARNIHPNDSKRIIRALEVYQLTGKPISQLQQQWKDPQKTDDRRLVTDDEQVTRDERRATKYNWTIIGLRREKTCENSRINSRVKKIIAAGLVDEVKSLLAETKPLSPQAGCAIGYAEIIDYLNNRMTLEDATELIKKNTRRFAKSQRTWFKTFRNVNWLDVEPDEPPEEIFSRTMALLKAEN